MAEMKKSYLNHVADLEVKALNRCLEKCSELGNPELHYQAIYDECGLRIYGGITRLLSGSIADSDSIAMITEFYVNLVSAKKLPINPEDILDASLERCIIQGFRYPDPHLWHFEYETREYQFPNGFKWCVTLRYVFPHASVFSGARFPELYKIDDSEGNEEIINHTLNDIITRAGIEPDNKVIDHTLNE